MPPNMRVIFAKSAFWTPKYEQRTASPNESQFVLDYVRSLSVILRLIFGINQEEPREVVVPFVEEYG